MANARIANHAGHEEWELKQNYNYTHTQNTNTNTIMELQETRKL